MDIVSLIIILLVAAFLVYEGKEAFSGLIVMRKTVEEIKKNKENVQICKDYMHIVLAYVVFAVLMVVFGIYFFMDQNYLYGMMFIVLAFFCVVFIAESVLTRTLVLYDNGFLYAGKMFKYRSVLKIEDKKKFLRGYRVKLTSDDEVYVSKKVRPLLEERLQKFKNRKKGRHAK